MTGETASIDGQNQNDSQVPLVVDLDGTFCRTDTLHEALLTGLVRHPLDVFLWPGWLRDGRAGFKARVADRGIVAAEDLPFNAAVLEWVGWVSCPG